MAKLGPEVMEAIEMAIQLEKDGQAFFLDAARKTQNELGKKMFTTLANDEVGHLKAFQALFDAATHGKEWKGAPGREPAKRVPIFIKETTPRSETQGTENEVGALQEAMRLEKKAIDFFADASSKAKDPLAKQIFDRIRQEEEHHYDLLQAELDAVTNSGFWFDIQEFRMDGRY